MGLDNTRFVWLVDDSSQRRFATAAWKHYAEMRMFVSKTSLTPRGSLEIYSLMRPRSRALRLQ
jgi:hypothetical protein